jgi:hypothetical protein
MTLMTADNAADFDWVGAQAHCTARSMFEQLRTRVREDVQKRNGLFDRQDGWKFEFFDEDDGEFEVARHVPSGGTSTKVNGAVTFAREGSRIHVRGEDVDVDFLAIVTLDVTGACRFVVGEAVYSDWEIRRMALELLFFEESSDVE